MSKKRLFVSIILNFILFMVIIRGLLLKLRFSNFVDSLKYAEILCPIFLAIVVVLYILSLIHSFISGNETCKLIEGLRLIFISSEIVIMIIKVAILVPYRGVFDISGSGIYYYIVIPLLSFISMIATKRRYGTFALLYGAFATFVYLCIISLLIGFKFIESPYKFMDILNQRLYKSIINFVIILGINVIVNGIIMCATKTKRVVKN
ncbi:MAG: hypothetical protein IKP77_06610 [Acholeplasmatales bacterium]|nr:hypothetical protein [Acholeplasmatales bacterium]